ncbi:Acetyltransferase (GNAT) family protein [Clostridium cavendishii DSM 21758]|uniref:Acetyltransferase (GNAT) family protein n=2 Tax=Clostridium TaxID=1485 RepID=A0A1M6FJL2_9CLOT|nr:Acetyltransferase (GNAT) family protein [Clostridium cavendishii DSM 21758]
MTKWGSGMINIRKFSLIDFIKISNVSDNYIADYFNNLVGKKSMLEKLMAVENILLLLEEKEIKGFIKLENYYDDIYILKDVYINNLLKKNIDKIKILKILSASKIIYEESLQDNFFYELSVLGFRSVNKTIFMSINLNNFNLDIDSSYDKSIKLFIKGKDEKIRCILQNQIFNEEGRIPLSVDDIFWDEKQVYYLEDMNYFIFDKEIPVGYGQIIFNDNKYILCNFGILKEYRNKGLGKRLLTSLLKIAKAKNMETIYIKVLDKNVHAISLYKSIGFTVESIIENFELK